MDRVEGAPGYIISWNVPSIAPHLSARDSLVQVAGLRTTLDKIRNFKMGWDGWLRKHQVDILCLQEVPIATTSQY